MLFPFIIPGLTPRLTTLYPWSAVPSDHSLSLV